MNCPRCNAADSSTADTRAYGPFVMRRRRCTECTATWSTREDAVQGSLQVATASDPQLPVATGRNPSSSSGSGSSLDLFSGSSQQSSLGDRGSDGAQTTALVVKRNLAFEIAACFADTWKAHHGAQYRLTPKDRSQLGRFLNPGKSFVGPSEEELAALPAVFAAYVADPDEFVGKQGWSLAYLLTNGGVNKYRALARSKTTLHPRTTRVMGTMQRFVERNQGGGK